MNNRAKSPIMDRITKKCAGNVSDFGKAGEDFGFQIRRGDAEPCKIIPYEVQTNTVSPSRKCRICAPLPVRQAAQKRTAEFGKASKKCAQPVPFLRKPLTNNGRITIMKTGTVLCTWHSYAQLERETAVSAQPEKRMPG